MYKKHLLLASFVFGITFALSFKLQIDYSSISEDAMTLVSIAIAVYITVPSFMVGSPYADKLKRTVDSEKAGMSQLGTLKTYLQDSMFFSILTIISRVLYSLEIVHFGKFYNDKLDVDLLISSFSCAVFALNILFLWLIFKLILVTMMNAATYDNEGDSDK